MQHYSAAQIERLLSYGKLADAIGAAFLDARISAPARMHLQTGESPQDVVLIMPAWRRGGLGVVKVVTVRAENILRSLPSVQGVSLLFDEASGAPVATLDATALTRWRTAATSLLAARYLARPESSALTMLGSGAVAGHLVRAYASEFSLREVLIWSRTQAHARRLAGSLALGADVNIVTTTDRESAVRRADIVCCATMAETALVSGALVKPGAHVDLVGAFTPQMRESDDALMRIADIYVDTREGALKEAGDLVQPLRAGVISASDIRGELVDLVQRVPGRQRPHATTITVFKSVGHSIEDLAAAELLIAAANAAGVSRET
jgi:ornithine cyclodeaminase